jgi:hypothetical protein
VFEALKVKITYITKSLWINFAFVKVAF